MRQLKRSNTVNEELDYSKPESWPYISEYPALVRFSQGFSEKRLELLNFAIMFIEQAYESLQKAEYKDNVGLTGMKDFKDTLAHADVLLKCWNALKRNANW